MDGAGSAGLPGRVTGWSGHNGGKDMVLKKIDAMSCGKVLGVAYAILGLIFGVIFALFSLLGLGGDSGGMFGAVFGIGAVILMPILYGLCGLIGGLICAWVYNLAAKYAGGVELDLQ